MCPRWCCACCPACCGLATVWLAHGVALRLQALARAVPDEGVGAGVNPGAIRDCPRPCPYFCGWRGGWLGDRVSERRPVDGGGFVARTAPDLLAIGLLPDTLLMFFTVSVMALTLRILGEGGAVTARQRLALGLLLGLAGLSKYTAVFGGASVAVVPAGGAWMGWLAQPVGWRWRCCWLWRWSRRCWCGMHKTTGFHLPTKQAMARVARGSGTTCCATCCYRCWPDGPLLWWGFAGWRRSAPPVRRLGAFFAIPWLVLVALLGLVAAACRTGRRRPGWRCRPLPVWRWPTPGGRAAVRARCCALVMALQAAARLALLGMMVSGARPWLAGRTAPNPFADLHGWDAASARALALAQQHGLHSASVQNWTLASRLRWYARPLPVHVLQDRFDQFDFRAGKLPAGASTLLVDWSQQPYAPPWASLALPAANGSTPWQCSDWATTWRSLTFMRAPVGRVCPVRNRNRNRSRSRSRSRRLGSHQCPHDPHCRPSLVVVVPAFCAGSLAAPLWLHWWEPAMSLALHHASAQVPVGVWMALFLVG